MPYHYFIHCLPHKLVFAHKHTKHSFNNDSIMIVKWMKHPNLYGVLYLFHDIMLLIISRSYTKSSKESVSFSLPLAYLSKERAAMGR